ncbi:hypothetical protein EBQ26_10500 [Allofranklinella schreckenbergeri]|uniref:DUF2335 domain-containing protein n=1 Tax=Allofranklinella schreckenbergeri TaxID=1076744 RepID=A0A3M6Q139_9BURK|nr:hypothetical protein [Allofranklinella schreckenbergeri]RMW96028.1 hypothetical protein EBQ26_10500 [Allofranklinella schreckenbergeri]
MSNRQTHARARSSRGDELALSETTTDAPLLPIEQLARLKEIAPEKVQWLFDKTSEEIVFRHAETRRVNTMTFIDRIAGLVFALLIACAGIGGAIYLAMYDKTVVASIIGGTTLVGLVTAFIAARKS